MRRILLATVGSFVALCSLIALPALAAKPGGGGTTSGNAQVPVIFLHGYQGWSGAGTGGVKNSLAGAGCVNLFSISYKSTTGIADAARQVNVEIDKILANTGQTSVRAVGHSMGGLVMQKTKATGKNVALGSPFKGTDTAYLCYDQSCLDMRPPGPGGSASACVWSTCDEIVNPDSSAQCSGKSAGCVRHNDIGNTAVASEVALATIPCK